MPTIDFYAGLLHNLLLVILILLSFAVVNKMNFKLVFSSH